MKILRPLILAVSAAVTSAGAFAETLELEVQGVLADILEPGESFGTLAQRMGDRLIYRFALDTNISNATEEDLTPFYNEFIFEGGDYYSEAFLIDDTGAQTSYIDSNRVVLGFEDDVDLTGFSIEGVPLSGDYDIFEVYEYRGFPTEQEVDVTFVGPSNWLPYNANGVLPDNYSPDMSQVLYTVAQIDIKDLNLPEADNELSFARVRVDELLDAGPEEVPTDFNADNTSDVLLRNGQSGQWYMNLMDGHNSSSAGFVSATNNQGWQVVAIRDLNTDRKDDILLRHSQTGRWYAYLMDGRDIVEQGFVAATSNQGWQVAAIEDLNGDGSADILLRHVETGRWYGYLLYGTGIIEDGFVGAASNQDWQLVDVADLNDDERFDIMLRHANTGRWYGYLMSGLSTSAQGFIGATPSTSWQAVTVEDFNADGNADLLLRNTGSGQWYSVLLNGLTVSGQGFVPAVNNQAWQFAGSTDLDANGQGDLLLRHSGTGRWFGYLLTNGRNIAGQDFVNAVSNQDWQLSGTGDLDDNATSDLLLRNTVTGRWYSYLMDGLGIASPAFSNITSNKTWQRVQ